MAIPPEVLARYNAVNAQAQTVAQTPFQSYSSNPNAFVAPINSTQQAGITQAGAAANEAQPYYAEANSALAGGNAATAPLYGQATSLAQQSAEAVDPTQIGSAQIGQFLSPYLSQVLGSTANVLNQNNQQQQAGQLGDAINSGAFGSDRTGLAAANLEQQQNLANAQIYSGIENQGFNTALGAAQQQQGVDLSAAQANRAALAGASGELSGLAGQEFGQAATTAGLEGQLGTGAQTAAESGAASELSAGTAAQQTQQAGLTALYNQFLQQQSYPFQTTQFLANIAEGTGALSGSTTSTTTPGGLFSDRRLKTDIRKIGKSFDGQTIYSFRYKDDPHNLARIGMMAQDVEKDHPDAVGLAGGYKTVDYEKATEGAAKRGHFAYGGAPILPGMYPTDLSAMLQSQEESFGPFSQAGLYGGAANGAPRGGSSYVPAANLPVGHLAVAGGLAPQRNAMQNIQDWSNLAKMAAPIAQKFRGAPTADMGSAGLAAGANDNSFSADQANADADSYDMSDVTSAYRGGLIRTRRMRGGAALAYADGGMPYDDQLASPALGLDIPNDPNDRSLPVPGAPPSQGSGALGTIGKIASTIGDILPFIGLAAGGTADRKGYDDGGSPGADDPSSWDPVLNSVGQAADAAPGLVGNMFVDVGKGVADAATGAWNAWNKIPPPNPAIAGGPVGYPIGPIKTPAPAAPVTAGTVARALGPNRPVHITQSSDGAPTVTPSPNDADSQAFFNQVSTDVGTPQGGGVTSPTGGLAPTDTTAPFQPPPDNATPATPNLGPPAYPAGLAGGTPDATMAPDATASPSAPKGGLAGVGNQVLHGAENAASTVGHALAPKGGFFDNLAHGQASSVVPFLAAIGAMGAAQTKYPLIALTQGLGAGAQAYMGQQKTAAEIAQTQASAAEIGAGAQQRNQAISMDLQKKEWLGLLRKDPAGPIVDPATGIHYSNTQGAPAGSAALATGTAAAAPSGGPTSPPAFKYMGPAVSAALPASATQFAKDAPFGGNLNPANIALSQHMANDVYSAAPGAETDLTNLNEQANAILSPKSGPLTQGALAPILEPAVARFNSLMTDAGHPEWQISGLGDAQIAQKLMLGQATSMSTAAGQNAFGALSQYEQASAGPGLDKHAAATLMAQMAVNATRTIDKRNVLDEAKQNAPNGNYETQDVLKAFDSDYKPADYNAMRDHVAAIYESPTWSKINTSLSKPGSTDYQRTVKTLDAYGAQHGIQRFSRVFTGG